MAFRIVGPLFVILFLIAGCGRSQSTTQETTQDNYQVTFTTEPAQPNIGNGVVIVTVKDGSAQPVDGARLSVEANMNHAGMVPVRADASGSEGGVYRVPLKWTMGGAWFVDVEITTQDDQIIRRRFPVDVK